MIRKLSAHHYGTVALALNFGALLLTALLGHAQQQNPEQGSMPGGGLLPAGVVCAYGRVFVLRVGSPDKTVLSLLVAANTPDLQRVTP
jgi:hypothetical protein